MTAADAPDQRPRRAAPRDGADATKKRVVLVAVGLLVLALVAGDLRVLLVGVPGGAAAALAYIAQRG